MHIRLLLLKLLLNFGRKKVKKLKLVEFNMITELLKLRAVMGLRFDEIGYAVK